MTAAQTMDNVDFETGLWGLLCAHVQASAGVQGKRACACVCTVQTQECIILATICISKLLPVVAMSAPPSF